MDTRMDKYIVVYQHSGMLDSKENEQTKTRSTSRMNLTNVVLRERSPSPTLSQRCLLRVHGTHPLQGLPLPWSPLPSFSTRCLPVYPSISASRQRQLLNNSPPPSLPLGITLALWPSSLWPLWFFLLFWAWFCCWSCELFSCFLQGEFQTYLWDISSGICLSWCPVRSNSWPPSLPPLPFITVAALGQFPIGFQMRAQAKTVKYAFSLG